MSDKLKLIEISEEVSINPVFIASVMKHNGRVFVKTVESIHPSIGNAQYESNKTYEELIKLLTD